MALVFPLFLFHPEHAVDGKIFHNAESLPKDGEGWVDTPAAFEPDYVKPAPPPDATSSSEYARRAGKPVIRFPAHFYRKNRPDDPCTVRNAQEYEALDKDVWRDTYAASAWDDAPADEPDETDGVQTERRASSRPEVPMVPLTPDQAQKLWSAKVPEVIKAIDGMTLEQTKILSEAEGMNPAGARKTVVQAIRARQALLKASQE